MPRREVLSIVVDRGNCGGRGRRAVDLRSGKLCGRPGWTSLGRRDEYADATNLAGDPLAVELHVRDACAKQ